VLLSDVWDRTRNGFCLGVLDLNPCPDNEILAGIFRYVTRTAEADAETVPQNNEQLLECFGNLQ